MNFSLINDKLMSFFQIDKRQDLDVILEKLGCGFLSEKKDHQSIANRIICEKYTQMYFRECNSLFQNMKDANIIFVVLKGAVLSSQIYHQINVKIPRDMDIFVSINDVDLLKSIMLKNGFIQGRILDGKLIPFDRTQQIFYSRDTHQQAPWIKVTRDEVCPYICIDINTSLLWGEAEEKNDLSDILTLDSIEPYKVCGVELYKFKKEYEFIALCLHHYKDFNSIYLLHSQGIKLKHFIDIYLYVNELSLDPQAVLKICKEYHLKKYIYYCVVAANSIFNDTKLSAFQSLFYEEKYDNVLNEYGLTDTESYMWDITLKDRIQYGNLREYFNKKLAASEKNKINTNEFYLH